MLAMASSHCPMLLGKIVPSVGKAFLRHFHPQHEGQAMLRAVNNNLRDKSFVSLSHGVFIQPRRTTLFCMDLFKSNFHSSSHPTLSMSKRCISSKTPDDKGDRTDCSKIDSAMNNKDFEAWKTGAAKQSILGAITSIIKLLMGLIIDFVLMIFRLLRSLFGDKGKQLVDKATKTGAGAEIKKGVEKSREIAARELPKINEKLEKSVPVAKQNIEKFGSRVTEELKSGKTGEEKFSHIMGVIGDLTKTSRGFQIFIAFLLVNFVFQVLKFIFWFLFGWGKCNCRKEDAKK